MPTTPRQPGAHSSMILTKLLLDASRIFDLLMLGYGLQFYRRIYDGIRVFSGTKHPEA